MAAVNDNMPLTLCFMALIVLGANAAAIDTITLKEEAYIRGPQVTLGEIAGVVGENAAALNAIELAPAAPPGDMRRLESALIQARLKAAGFAAESFEIRGAANVLAKTLQSEITPDVVEQNLRAFIEHQMPWQPENTVINVDVPAQSVVVSEGEVGFEWTPDPEFRYLGTGCIRGAVTVDGEVKRGFICRVSIEAYDEVLVAAGAIDRGKSLSATDVTVERRALSGLKDTVFHDPSELEGFIARRPVGPGQVITKRSLAPQLVIKRNQLVSVETRAGGLQVQTQARAGSDGAAGDLVTCINPNSNQPFQGVVRKDGVVVVE
jgi:flagella basal body P-ring formation protein FlgA